MGAICYKPKPSRICHDDLLKVLNDKHVKDTITEPDAIKTIKTEEWQNLNLMTFGNMS